MSEFLRIRSVEPIPLRIEGRTLVAFRDPMGLSEESAVLAPEMAVLATLLNGERSHQEILKRFEEMTEESLSLEDLSDFASYLDQNFLLDNPRSRARLAELEAEYARLEIREPARQGFGYPQEPAEIEPMLEGFMEPTLAEETSGRVPRAILAPHIDLARGGACYASAYRQLLDLENPLTIVVFGTGHQDVKGLVSVTRKHYDTPLGLVQSDQEFIAKWAEESPIPPGCDELAHRFEHSIEFQALWLQHILGKRVEFSLVPVLVGSFQSFIDAERSPLDDEALRGCLEAFRLAIEAHHRPVCLLGSVDLAHMGPRFGHPFKMDRARLAEMRAADLKTLAPIEAGDAERFFELVAAEGDKRNICGFPPIYSLLTVMGQQHGTLLKYEQSLDETGSAVSFCSMVFEG